LKGRKVTEKQIKDKLLNEMKMNDKIKDGMGEACPEDTRNVHRLLAGKPEEKRPLGRPRFK
jgi:hypothetical protein